MATEYNGTKDSGAAATAVEVIGQLRDQVRKARMELSRIERSESRDDLIRRYELTAELREARAGIARHNAQMLRAGATLLDLRHVCW